MLRSIMSDCRASSLLHKVQMARIFADSKTFVDMTIKSASHSPNDILRWDFTYKEKYQRIGTQMW